MSEKKQLRYLYLKSNMDRFIELVDNLFTDLKNNLKSNMDRFIVIALLNSNI